MRVLQIRKFNCQALIRVRMLILKKRLNTSRLEFSGGKLRQIAWTAHSRAKMRYYGLSESRVKRIIHSPKRTEEGIAPKTVAMMQSAGSVKHPYELWVMLQDVGQKRKVISAWRYPGITKPGSVVTLKLLEQAFEESNENKEEKV